MRCGAIASLAALTVLAALTIHAPAPPTAGASLVKADLFIGGVDRPYLSQRGVVA